MAQTFYSNTELTKIKERLNQEILRRGTFKWWDPLTTPSVGIDRSSPLSMPDIGERVTVDEKTYTVNTPSEGSIERTRNIFYSDQGDNPAGPTLDSSGVPNTSASQWNMDEIKNFIVGLSKINDINLFYGRDEITNLAYRDPSGIEEVLQSAENSIRNKPLAETDLPHIKNDPNGGTTYKLNPSYPVAGHSVEYPMEDGQYVMPSGEYNGEEVLEYEGLGPHNFYDDYGASPGDSDYHPYNRFTSAQVRRDQDPQGNYRDEAKTVVIEGGVSSYRFGPNPRNPERGEQYKPIPVYGGVPGGCNVACTGLCHVTCDNECSESCTTSCWGRCGDACTSACGNVCTGCTTLCYSSCKTKCENSTGYSCLKAGAKAIKITTTGGTNGEAAKNNFIYETYSCDGCSYSCQFYPNKKTECWDSGCMGKCFISCNTACSTSCYGGCINNDSEGDNGESYKTGKGNGCSGGCTLNCIGFCSGVCEGYCIQTCWHGCKQSCTDNCAYECSTNCGGGCAEGCSSGCTGCSSCANTCESNTSHRGCVGCGYVGGCTSTCQHDCNSNCMAWGCRSVCGVDGGGACEANCRLSCMGTSCTARCEDACSGRCSTCVNTCGFQCGACSSMCSTGCESSCNINCSDTCRSNCTENCVNSCSEFCGGCSDLCYSCVGMCIGVCSVKCENGCSSCANNCSWWCDGACNQECFASCDIYCISACSGSCATYMESETLRTTGPERGPISSGYIYPNPKNRWEERESFRIIRKIAQYPPLEHTNPIPEYLIWIFVDDEERNFNVLTKDDLEFNVKQTSIDGGVFNVDHITGEITVDEDMLADIIAVTKPNADGGGGLFVSTFTIPDGYVITDNDIVYNLPFGFEYLDPIWNGNKLILIVQRDKFLFPEEEEALNG